MSSQQVLFSTPENKDEAEKEEPTTAFEKCINAYLENRVLQWLTIFIIFALTIPAMVYFFMYRGFPQVEQSTCLTSEQYRVPCGVNYTHEACTEAKCCYDKKFNMCYHYFPSKYKYLPSGDDIKSYRPSEMKTPFRTMSSAELKLDVVEVDETELEIILHNTRTEFSNQTVLNKNYVVNVSTETLMVQIYRNSGDLLLTTANGPLIASSGYWEWTIQFKTEHLFGLGQLSLESDETITKVIYNNENDHNTLPIFMAAQKAGWYGVRVKHDGPLEVSVLPSKLVVIKSLAGNGFAFKVFTGPTPKELMLQMRMNNNEVYPRWILGPHLCRANNINLHELIEERKKKVNSIDAAYVSDCLHENLLMMVLTEDLTGIQKDLNNLIADVNAKGKFLLSVPPHVPLANEKIYKRCEELDVLYKSSDGKVWIGTYLNSSVAFVDFTSNNIGEWMSELRVEIVNILGDKIDGYVLIDNWPAETTYAMIDEDLQFPYLPQTIKSAMSKTIPHNLKSASSEHILLHNDYGASHLNATRIYLKAPVIMSSSYSHGMTSPTVIRNVETTWGALKKSIVTNLYHSVFANPLISSPVCGNKYFNTEKEEAVCIRWYITSATMPLFRAASNWPEDDFNFGKEIALRALSIRETLSFYYYTLIYNNEPIIRPMFYEFHNDPETFALDEQYMVGDGLLVAQPLTSDVTKLNVYLPPQNDWHEYWTGSFYKTGWNSISVVESDFIMFIKAGCVLPIKTVDGIFDLLIALDRNSSAIGNIQLDNTNLVLQSSSSQLTVGSFVAVECTAYNFGIGVVKIYQYQADVKNVVINYDLCSAGVGMHTINYD